MSKHALRYASLGVMPTSMRGAAERALAKQQAAPAPAPAAAEPQGKYRNSVVHVDGFRFDSKKEARRYEALKALRDGGQVAWFIRQAPFHLPGNIRYLADFLVVWSDGRVTVEDVKSSGTRTQVYINKRKQVRQIYGVEIVEV